ncbi:MAG: 16S rRNA (cytosine(1402)-N(4))-methyltransferase RsmH [Kiritimatiellae bacterium]|nr:16S rRNA (cytosine(1402)-N(4))-methyltransferase RsmH [Kiritimatiellia bacterium]
MGANEHVPVLLEEAMDALQVKRGGRYVDGTFGRGGHAREIARRGGEVLGIDRDGEAVASARGMKVVKGNHGEIERIVNENGWSEADGVLLDLGVSSPQLDDAGRGFSFLRDGPLDMRMDRSGGVTAADIVNFESAERLEEIFRVWGEEPRAHMIAKAIQRARDERGVRFARTLQFAEFIGGLLGRRGGHHPATRVFQALRMEVNDEMGGLKRALGGGMRILKPGGRFAVITFESITDRAVKRFFAAHVGKMASLQGGGEEWRGEEPRAAAVTRRAVRAGREEISRNPRSRSAKLRAVEKIRWKGAG